MGCHLRIKLEQLFQALCVVLETASDINALQYFIIAFVRLAQILRHGVRIVEVGNRVGEVMFSSNQNVLDATCKVRFVLVGQRRHRKRVPA